MFKEMNILKLFFESPEREFNVREVARIARITPATASKRLKELKGRGILRHRKERILDLYKADLESDAYRDLKVYYTIRKLKESGFIEALNQLYLKPTIVLFGSASAGLDTETSDIDILILSETKKDMQGIEKYEKKINRKIQIFIQKDVKEIKNEHLINNILGGITLQGTVKWT